jgi:hypothetical protein
LISSSTTIPKDAPGEPAATKSSDLEMFDAVDSGVYYILLLNLFESLIIFLLVDVE